MSEKRYVEVYTYPDSLSPEEKVPANATITLEAYEVSDEQLSVELEAEAREEAIAEITKKKKAEITGV